MPTPTNNFEAAVLAAQLFGPVFPCRPKDVPCLPHDDPAKKPKKAKEPLVTNWGRAATRDCGRITEWWDKTPTALPGLVTGGKARLTVLDVDVKNGQPGMASLKALGPLPETFTVLTPSQGLHFHFQNPPDIFTGNTQDRLGKGLDTRGEGGFVIAPGTIMPDGKPPYRVILDAPIAVLPAELAALLSRDPKPDRQAALGALGKSVHQLSEATVSRHELLLHAAGQMGPWVRLKHLSEAEVYRALLDAYRDNGALAEHGQEGFDRTFRDGLEWGWSHRPNRIPERARVEALTFEEKIEDAIRLLKGKERLDVITARYRDIPDAQFLRGMRNASRRYSFQLHQDGRHTEAMLLVWIEHYSDNEFHRSQASARSLAKVMNTSHKQIMRFIVKLEAAGMIAAAPGLDDGQACYVIVPSEADFTGTWLAPIRQNFSAA